MSYPTPQEGLVIRYSYLWSDEARAGAEEGSKDRPCAILLALQPRDGDTSVLVLPVTHLPPNNPTHAIEIPAATKRRLGLDDERSWIVLTELNQFLWPGPDLRPLRGGGPDAIVYGELPASLYRQVRDRWLALYDRGIVKQVTRTS